MRGWAANQTISGKTIDLLIKEGFDAMEAFIDSNRQRRLVANQNSTWTAEATSESSAVA